MSTTGVPGCLPLMARSRSSPERPGILMSETTRSNGSSPSTASASSAVAAVVTWQWLAVNADRRKRSTDALSSTTRTRRDSTFSPPLVSCLATVLLVTSRPFLGSEFGSALFRRAELTQEFEPLARESVLREGQRLAARRGPQHLLRAGRLDPPRFLRGRGGRGPPPRR